MSDPRLRQFALTGGRARAADELPLEAPIVARDTWYAPPGTLPEHLEVVTRSSAPTTLADLASAMSTPASVMRVFVLDLVEAGALRADGRDDAEVPPHRDISLLQETLRGIASL